MPNNPNFTTPFLNLSKPLASAIVADLQAATGKLNLVLSITGNGWYSPPTSYSFHLNPFNFFTNNWWIPQQQLTFTSGAVAAAIAENNAANQLVYTAHVANPGKVKYQLKASGDYRAFSIDNQTGEVRLLESADFERKVNYGFTVIATIGNNGRSTEQAVTLSIRNVDEVAPTITSAASASVDENTASGKLVNTATSTDADYVSGATRYSLKNGADAALFSINSTTGEITLLEKPDFERKASYQFTVIATDAAQNSSEKAITLSVNNLDEVAPTFTSGSSAAAIAENSGANQVVYTATSTDTADIATGNTRYSLKNVDDASDFSINADSGAVSLRVNPDYEQKSSYRFTVVATDAAGNSREQAVTLPISDVNDTIRNDGVPVAVDDVFALKLSADGKPAITMENLFGTDGTGPINDYDSDSSEFTSITITKLPDYGNLILDKQVVSIQPNKPLPISLIKNNLLQYAPPPGFIGNVTFKYTVSDDKNTSNEAEATIQVNGASTSINAPQLSAPLMLIELDQSAIKLPATTLGFTGSGGMIMPQVSLAQVKSDGSYIAAWSERDSSTDNSIYLQRIDSTGHKVGAVQIIESPGVSDKNETNPEVTATGSDGSYSVQWRGYTTQGTATTFKQAFHADGSKNGEVIITPTAPGKTFHPIGNSGQYTAIWLDKDAEGDNSIFTQRVSSNNVAIGNSTRIEAHSTSQESNPTLLNLNNNGDYLLAWCGQNAAGVESIFAQRFNANGSSGKLQEIAPITSKDNFQIMSLQNGKFALCWHGIADKNTYLQLLTENAEPQGTRTTLPDYAVLTDIKAVGTEGKFAASFYSLAQSGLFLANFNADSTLNGKVVPLSGSLVNNYGHMANITPIDGTENYLASWQYSSIVNPVGIFNATAKFNLTGQHSQIQLIDPKTISGYSLAEMGYAESTPTTYTLGKDGAFAVAWSRNHYEATYYDYNKATTSGATEGSLIQHFNPDGTPAVKKLITNDDTALVKSNQAGHMYLVNSKVNVTKLTDITSAPDAQWNSMEIDIANHAYNLPLTGLDAGKYVAYATNNAGELSAVSTNSLDIIAKSNLPNINSLLSNNTSLDSLLGSTTTPAASINPANSNNLITKFNDAHDLMMPY